MTITEAEVEAAEDAVELLNPDALATAQMTVYQAILGGLTDGPHKVEIGIAAYVAAAHEHGGGWRAIETSEPPKDGTPIEVVVWGQLRVVRWFEPWGNWQDTVYTDIDPETDEIFGIGAKLPTHWRPIELPPLLPSDSEGGR